MIKLEFRGHPAFPLAVGEQVMFDPIAAEELYANNEDGPGGRFPIGGNQMWHAGIHLFAAENTPVRAVAPGRIVAARLDPIDPDVHLFGSTRFVLIKHDFSLLTDPAERDPRAFKGRKISFYSLYMHLDWPDDGGEATWLRSYLPYLAEGVSFKPSSLRRVGAARDANPVRRSGIHCYADPKRTEFLAHLPVGTVLEYLGAGKVRVRGLEIDAGYVSPTRAGDCAVVVDQAAVAANVAALRGGGVVKLDIPVAAGEVIGFVGPLGARARDIKYGLHLETFSAANDIVAADALEDWVTLDDDPDDVICQSASLTESVGDPELADVLGQLTWDGSDSASYREALYHLKHSLSEPQREKLRRFIVYVRSFWATRWFDLADQNPEWQRRFDVTGELLEAAETVMWWEQAAAKRVELPASPEVYHYHPLRLLEYIHSRLPSLVSTPLFYRRVRGEGQLVVRPTDLSYAAEPYHVSGNASYYAGCYVWCYDPPGPDWLLGRGVKLVVKTVSKHGTRTTTTQGLADVGDVPLSEVFHHPRKHPPLTGIPHLSPSDRNVWAALWHSEGNLNARNSYDSAYVSFGPFQQTYGQRSERDEGYESASKQHYKERGKGELQPALAAACAAAPDVRARWFQPHQITFGDTEKLQGIEKGAVRVGGKPLLAAADKKQLRDFLHLFVISKADEDPAFRKAFLTYGFGRLEKVKGLTAPHRGSIVRLDQVYRTELARALLLDWHLNNPVHFIPEEGPKWLTAARAVLGDDDFDPADITIEQEYQLIRRLLDERAVRGRMFGAGGWGRAGRILLAAKGFDPNEGVAQWGAFAKTLGFGVGKNPSAESCWADFKSKNLFTADEATKRKPTSDATLARWMYQLLEHVRPVATLPFDPFRPQPTF